MMLKGLTINENYYRDETKFLVHTLTQSLGIQVLNSVVNHTIIIIIFIPHACARGKAIGFVRLSSVCLSSSSSP